MDNARPKLRYEDRLPGKSNLNFCMAILIMFSSRICSGPSTAEAIYSLRRMEHVFSLQSEIEYLYSI